MVQDNCLPWYNYVTNEYDLRGAPTTDEEAAKYLPQGAAEQGLYRCRRTMGKDIIQAMIATLKACIGEKSS